MCSMLHLCSLSICWPALGGHTTPTQMVNGYAHQRTHIHTQKTNIHCDTQCRKWKCNTNIISSCLRLYVCTLCSSVLPCSPIPPAAHHCLFTFLPAPPESRSPRGFRPSQSPLCLSLDPVIRLAIATAQAARREFVSPTWKCLRLLSFPHFFQPPSGVLRGTTLFKKTAEAWFWVIVDFTLPGVLQRKVTN